MQQIFEIINNLKSLSGNKQLDYLKSQKDNELLKEILLYTYDTRKMYKVQEKSFNKCFDKFKSTVLKNRERTYEDLNLMSWQIFKGYLDSLASQKGVSELDIEKFIAEFWNLYDHEQLELYKSVLFKDLRINMGVSSFNKVWSDLFEDFPYMGATGLNNSNIKKIKYPCIMQLKEDGLFCNSLVNESDIRYISRQGNDLDIGTFFNKELFSLQNNYGKDMVFTGEIRVAKSKEILDYILSKTKKEKEINEIKKLYDSKKIFLPRAKSNGIINDENRPEYLNKFIYYILWDAIPEACFWQKEYYVPYIIRFKELKKYITEIESVNVRYSTTSMANSYEDIESMFIKVRDIEEEGLIIKNTDSIWKDTKSMAFKIKAKEDCDLRIIGFEEGKGRLSGMCGNVLCISECGNLKVSVKPRTDSLCEDVWNNKDKYLDKILAVEYNEKVKNKTCDGYTLQHPVWIEIRTDKDLADKSENIK